MDDKNYDEQRASRNLREQSELGKASEETLDQFQIPESGQNVAGGLGDAEFRADRSDHTLATVFGEMFHGPVAHPDHFREYEATLPGAADRMLSLVEEAQTRTLRMQEKSLEADAADRKAGMYLGASLFASLITGAFVLALVLREPVVPGLFLTATVMGGIGLFVRGRQAVENRHSKVEDGP